MLKIMLPIKQVPETKGVKMDEKTGTVIRTGVQLIVNPLDLYAIQLAVNIKKQMQAEITVISMGPPTADKALREAISMGADKAWLISDKMFAGSDTWATSYILSNAIRKIGDFDLIICGERATDGDTGQVGPGIGAFLDLPVISYVNKLVNINETSCTVTRIIEEGGQKVSSQFPLLLTVVKEISNPDLPTLSGKKLAKKIEIPILTNVELNLEPRKIGLKGSPTRVAKIYRPKLTRECEKIVISDEASLEVAKKKILERCFD